MQGIINAKDSASILSALMQTGYARSLSDFGGLNIKQSLIDFALSRNLAQSMDEVVRLTPHQDKHVLMNIIRRWALHNIELALEAKVSGRKYEDIERYLIDYGQYNHLLIKEVMKEDSVERMLQRLLSNSSQTAILERALSAYSERKNVTDAIAAIEINYHQLLERTMKTLYNRNEATGRIIKMEIGMKNLTTLIRAKSRGIDFDAVSGSLIKGGPKSVSDLKKSYTSADGMESFIQGITEFNLKDALLLYKQNKRLISFEIAMRNSIRNAAMKVLSHSVLSLSSIVAYVYLKDVEVTTLRILIKGKAYGLQKDELAGLIVWKAN